MDRNWKVSEDRVRASKIHELIVRLDFPIIYTTNYDRNIEAAFEARGRNYVKVANARNMAKIREGVTQIVKFHGDFDDDESLVITETGLFQQACFRFSTRCEISVGWHGQHSAVCRVQHERYEYPAASAQLVENVESVRL